MQHSLNFRERCGRLSRMSWDELLLRVRQQAAKGWDALVHIGQSYQDEKYDPAVRERGRFFFGCEDVPALLDLLREQHPATVEQIVARAEGICRHRFDLLGYRDVDYGDQIDWHRDAVNGKRAPRLPWFRIPYLDFAEVGDAKIIWELSRHQHLVTLAKAHLMTGRMRYLRELLEQWYHWQEHNPYGMGINWSSSLEVAFRSLSWIWVSQLLTRCESVPPAFFFDVSRALLMNARHIERYLSTYFSPNTHLLGEGVALFFIGTLVPGSSQTRHWQEVGWKIVLQESDRQVLPDGMHFEQSTYYHVYALDFFLHTRILAGLNGLSVPAALDQTITKMLTVLAAVANPGPPPSFGDDDGGRVFDPRRNRREHITDPLSTGAALFNRGDWKSPVGGISEETIWLLGVEGAKRFESLQAEPQNAGSFALASSGIYVMGGSGRDSHQLVVDAGPQAAGRPGHSHADALSVQVAVNGHMLLVDPGTDVYVDGNGKRDRFRSTPAHNTVQIDGVSQADPRGPFGWSDLARASADQWITGESFDLFAGSHDGYTRLPDPVVHRRHIFSLKDTFWLIRDVLTAEDWHEIQGSWHFAPGEISAVPGGARFSNADHAGLILLIAASKEWRRTIGQDSISPAYGQNVPAPVLHFDIGGHLPVEFATLVIPVTALNAQPGFLSMAEGATSDGLLHGYIYSTAAEESYFVFSLEAAEWQLGPWASDAAFLFCRIDANENLAQFVLCNGSFLEFRGQRVFTSSTAVACAEWYQKDLAPHFCCSGDSTVTLCPSQVLGMASPVLTP